MTLGNRISGWIISSTIRIAAEAGAGFRYADLAVSGHGRSDKACDPCPVADRRVRHLPVLDGRELVGIVSLGDAVKARMEAVEAQTAAMREYILS